MCDALVLFGWAAEIDAVPDRGIDVAADNNTAQAIVDFLTAGLAEHTYGH